MLQLKASMEQIQMPAIDQAQFLAGQEPKARTTTTNTNNNTDNCNNKQKDTN